MKFPAFLRSRQWMIGRRIALALLVVVLAIRNYGDTLSSWLQKTDNQHDVVITKSEFRPDLGDVKPAWIIGLKNESDSTSYEQIELEATYKDQEGNVLEVDTFVVKQKVLPGNEKLIASKDTKSRPRATTGTLRVVGAKSVTP
ncbi:MAG TPA: hypothetical protein VFE29_04790 [Terriglobia bacterium]|nr:hypothetical protein [Terriglobia bacterium]